VSWAALKGPLLARAGGAAEAEEIVRDALALIDTTDALNLHARTLASLAEVQRIAGRDHESAETAKQAVQLFQQKGNTAAANRALALVTEHAAR
jgi:hypothetical protein